MTRRALIVVGAGGHGRVIVDAALASGFEIASVVDDARAGERMLGFEVGRFDIERTTQLAANPETEVLVAIGDNRARQRVCQLLLERGASLATLIHPRACVSPNATVGAGSVVLAQAVVGPGSTLGEGVIVNHGATVDHDTRVGEYAHLSPGVHMGGEVSLGPGTHLGVGVSVRNKAQIGSWSIVGVGAAVIADLPDSVVAFGVPAVVIRRAPGAPQ
jgi:acetyltransferase EpsM